jgi:hypothetical protein
MHHLPGVGTWEKESFVVKETEQALRSLDLSR